MPIGINNVLMHLISIVCVVFDIGPDKKLRACDVCGSYLSIFDSDK
jgi:hypothetical protein